MTPHEPTTPSIGAVTANANSLPVSRPRSAMAKKSNAEAMV
jgi:hypothetical protein